MKLSVPPSRAKTRATTPPASSQRACSTFQGQLSIDPDTREVCHGDIYDHARLALDNVDRVLKEAGVPRENVVFCRVYTPDVKYWGPINEVYAEFFGDHKPGRVVVSTTEMHFGCLVEIEAIAEVDED